MAPLLACSVAALAVGIERAVVLALERRRLERRARAFLAPVRGGDAREARRALNRAPDFLSRMLRASIGARRPVDPDEPQRLWRRRLGVLSTVATIAPLLGLLGTVTGMIAAFQQIQTLAAAGRPAGPGDLAGGIWEALLTTAAGLIVAIPAYVVHGLLSAAVNRLIERLEALHALCLREYRALHTACAPKVVATRRLGRRVA
jgi:biopolymer transport protein ExbB